MFSDPLRSRVRGTISIVMNCRGMQHSAAMSAVAETWQHDFPADTLGFSLVTTVGAQNPAPIEAMGNRC